MRSLGELRFEEFPPGDDLWWLTWFDHHSTLNAAAGSLLTNGPGLRATFARLPGARADDLPILDEALAGMAVDLHSALLQTGWLPVLSIGLVVQAGRVVGQLGAKVLPFVFDSRACPARIEAMRVPGPPGPPSHWRLTLSGRVKRARAAVPSLGGEDLPGDRALWTGSSSHPMLDVEGGRMLSISGEVRGAPTHLLLPCPEVARVMYAPHRALASAVLDDSWERQKGSIFDLEAEDPSEPEQTMTDAEWEVAPLVAFSDHHIVLAANMLFNPLARRRANLLHHWIVSEPGGGRLACNLPFDWDRLELEVACFPVPLPGRGSGTAWFGYEVVGVRWPDPPLGPPRQIRAPAHSNAQGEVRLPSDEPGFPTRAKAPPPAGEPVDATQGSDPGSGSEPTAVEVEGPMWTNGPAVVRAPKKVSYIRTPRPPVPPPPPAADVSAGRPAPGAAGPAPADPMSVETIGGSQPESPMFERVLEMLRALTEERSIASHAAVPWPDNPRLLRGGVPVWPFPAVPVVEHGVTRRWYVRDFPNVRQGRAEVRRTAMVRSILTDAGQVYWIEIEQRSAGEGFNSLLFSMVQGAQLYAVVAGLLKAAAQESGVWPRLGLAGIHASRPWPHYWSRGTVEAEGSPQDTAMPLDGTRALRAMRSAAKG